MLSLLHTQTLAALAGVYVFSVREDDRSGGPHRRVTHAGTEGEFAGAEFTSADLTSAEFTSADLTSAEHEGAAPIGAAPIGAALLNAHTREADRSAQPALSIRFVLENRGEFIVAAVLSA